MGNIRDTANAVYLDGPGTQPSQPEKAKIRSLFGTVEDTIVSSAEGYVIGTTWPALNAIDGTRAGQPGRVPTTDTGTHTDPVTGDTVPNSGEYSWSPSPEGWERTGDVIDPAALQAQIDEQTQGVQRYVDSEKPGVKPGLKVWSLYGQVETDQTETYVTSGITIDGYSEDLLSRHLVQSVAHPDYAVIEIDKFGNILRTTAWLGVSADRAKAAVGLEDGGRAQVYVTDGESLVKVSRDPAGDDRVGGVTDGAILWVNENGATRAPRAAWVDRTTTIGAAIDIIWLVVGYGQSLSLGANTTVLATSTALNPGRGLMWETGTRPLQVQPLIDNDDVALDYHQIRNIVDVREVADSRGTLFGETPTSRAIAALCAGMPANEGFMGWTMGIGSAPISLLVKGTVPYANLMQSIAEARLAGGLLGKTVKVAGILWKQGEADAATNLTTYQAALAGLQADLEADVQSLTDQAEGVPFVSSQGTGRNAGSADYPTPPIALLNLAIADPDKFILVSPDYYLPHLDTLHLTANSTALLGEAMGGDLASLLDGSAPEPLHIVSAVASGSNVAVTFNEAIAIDTTVVTDPGNRGFGLMDAGGVTISSVGSPSGATIVVTLSGSAPGGAKLTVARQPITDPGSGPNLGARSCIRSAATGISTVDGSTTARWAQLQEIIIT